MPRKEIASWSISHLQIIDEQGKVDKALEPELSPDQLTRLYRAMLTARRADERMLKLQRQGRIGTFGPSTGQEAVTCSAALAMTDKDWFVGAFRELPGRLMRGHKLSQILTLWNGFEEGSAIDPALRTLPDSIIVAAQLPHAVGLAYAMQYRGEKDAAVVAFVGDGGTSEGDFHESLNFASVWQSPVVFVVTNNQWAISTPARKQTHSRSMAQKAIAYDMPGIQVDGNDALAMYAAVREALVRAKDGGGPTLIEAVTYRLMMHTTADDPTRYRSEEELALWRAKDPIPRMKTYLEGKGLWDAKKDAALEEEIAAEIAAGVAEFEARKDFKPDAPFDYVFGTPHPVIEEQRQMFLAELEEAHDA